MSGNSNQLAASVAAATMSAASSKRSRSVKGGSVLDDRSSISTDYGER